LFAGSSVFARVGSTPVNREAGIKCDLIQRRILIRVPIARRLVIAGDRDLFHATDETFIVKYVPLIGPNFFYILVKFVI
jgi:hypothetical protein